MSKSRLTGALGLTAALVALLHCGTDPGSVFPDPGASPCATVYQGLCGAPCAEDAECAGGLYCASDNKCTADCAPSVACADGSSCSAEGRCAGGGFPPGLGDGGVSGDAMPGDATCADTDVALTKTVPRVLFLLDQSSSMQIYKFPSGDSNNCAAGCRWSVLKEVLIGPVSKPGGLLKDLAGEAEMGVELYSATDNKAGDSSFLPFVGDPVCPRFNGKAFDGLTFSLNAYPAAEGLLRSATVDDDTPTGPAVRTVAGLAADGTIADAKGFAALAGDAPKVIVLVTDGEPGVCGASYASDEGRADVVSAVQDSFTHGIRTFVIAIGDTVAGPHFKHVANAGQGLDPATGAADAIRPDTPDKLVDALKKVVLDARTCAFDLNGEVQPGMESLGTVTLNGKPLPLVTGGAGDGWRLDTPSRIELVGSACEELKASPDAALSARFPCDAVAPIPK